MQTHDGLQCHVSMRLKLLCNVVPFRLDVIPPSDPKAPLPNNISTGQQQTEVYPLFESELGPHQIFGLLRAVAHRKGINNSASDETNSTVDPPLQNVRILEPRLSMSRIMEDCDLSWKREDVREVGKERRSWWTTRVSVGLVGGGGWTTNGSTNGLDSGFCSVFGSRELTSETENGFGYLVLVGL